MVINKAFPFINLLILNFLLQCAANADKSRQHPISVDHVGQSDNHNQPSPENSFLSGIKQRLLSFIFQGIWNEETDETLVGHLLSCSCTYRKYHLFSQLLCINVSI